MLSRWHSPVYALLTAAILAAPTVVGSLQSAQTPAGDVSLRLIVVSSTEEAQRVLERLTRGEDFASLAREVSIDPSSDAGGSIGRVAVSSLRPELRRALEGLAPGQMSPAVQIPTGFAIRPSRLTSSPAQGRWKWRRDWGAGRTRRRQVHAWDRWPRRSR